MSERFVSDLININSKERAIIINMFEHYMEEYDLKPEQMELYQRFTEWEKNDAR